MINTEHGVEEDQPGGHPNVLNEFYGTDQADQARSIGGTSASHMQDELEARVDASIAEDQADNIRHAGVDVPAELSPFTAAQEYFFFEALNRIVTLNIVPTGYSVAPAEWPRGEYPVWELVCIGSAQKTISIELPVEMWWPQAVKWVQGSDCMTKFMVDLNL
jgi:hypothetical protein